MVGRGRCKSARRIWGRPGRRRVGVFPNPLQRDYVRTKRLPNGATRGTRPYETQRPDVFRTAVETATKPRVSGPGVFARSKATSKQKGTRYSIRRASAINETALVIRTDKGEHWFCTRRPSSVPQDAGRTAIALTLPEGQQRSRRFGSTTKRRFQRGTAVDGNCLARDGGQEITDRFQRRGAWFVSIRRQIDQRGRVETSQSPSEIA